MSKNQKMQYFQKGWKIKESVTLMEWNVGVNVDDNEICEYNLKNMYRNKKHLIYKNNMYITEKKMFNNISNKK